MAGYMFGAADDDEVTTRSDTPAAVEEPSDTETDSSASDDGGSGEIDRTQESVSGLPPIWIDDLPDEALLTLELIDADGPYPYSKDGSTFQNREGYLPDHDRGYYREFTVDTPGLDHRGARRIVGGAGGELYYTDDHYDSFSEIMDW